MDITLTPAAAAEINSFIASCDRTGEGAHVAELGFCLRPLSEGGSSEVNGFTGYWALGGQLLASVNANSIREVSGVKLLVEPTMFGNALLGRTVDFRGGEWHVY